MIGSIIYLAIVVIVIAGMWKTFEKAGQAGLGMYHSDLQHLSDD